MKRKFFMAFAFALLFFCMGNVKAYTNDGIVNEKHVMYYTMIQKNLGNDKWDYMIVNIYDAGEDVLFQIGETHKERADIAIQNRYYNDRILSVLENGFGKISYKDAGVLSNDEVYVATHLALNFAYTGKPFEEFDNYYRASIHLKGKDKENADNIINAAKNMLLAPNTYSDSSSLEKIGGYSKDDVEEKYFSQCFELNMRNRTLKSYDLSIAEEDSYCGIDFLIKNENGRFKLLVPIDKAGETFSVKVNVDFDYDVDRLYLADDGIETFVVLSKKTESESLSEVVSYVKEDGGEIDDKNDETESNKPSQVVPPFSDDKSDKDNVSGVEVPKDDDAIKDDGNKGTSNDGILNDDKDKDNGVLNDEIQKEPEDKREEVTDSDTKESVVPEKGNDTNENEKNIGTSSESNSRESYTKITNEELLVRNEVEHKESYAVRKVLPRTGDDFFLYKILILNFFNIFGVCTLKKHRLLL